MSSEATLPSPVIVHRSTPDLVASDEALTALMLGLEHLRRRLEIARRERAKAGKQAGAAAAQANSKAAIPPTPASAAPMAPSDRQWFYEAEPALEPAGTVRAA